MYNYLVEGGVPINGTIVASGNKNAALPCIAATLLTQEAVILHNIPRIEDTCVMLKILQALGVEVENIGAHDWRIQAANIRSHEIPRELSHKIRASILFAGPLLARTGEALMPPPGGDVIGRRRLDTHFLALEEMGAEVKINGKFAFEASHLRAADIFLDEASVTATENALMLASVIDGTTIISNAASEPHIQDLCKMLSLMGVKIEGIGSNILRITGTSTPHGCEFTIGPDFMEVGSYIGMAAATGGSITIKGIRPYELRPMKSGFSKLGIQWTCDKDSVTVASGQELKVNMDVGGHIPKIDDAPWPGFPADLTSIMTVVATQVEGTVLIFEKMFESRMFFVDKLINMGACITLCDPHRAVVTGPSRLHCDHLVSPDVRAGMAMLIAAMLATGESTISNVYQIERGYEGLVERLQGLGAKIRRVEIGH